MDGGVEEGGTFRSSPGPLEMEIKLGSWLSWTLEVQSAS